MIQYLTYVVLVFVLIFKTIFPFGMIRQTTAAETGSLAATDALGRQAVSAGQSEKKVGIFYFLWNGEHSQSGPYDITKIIENDPLAYTSVERWEAAGGGPYAVWHHWGEPLFGYYFQSDRWVVSLHCQMLTDAGVDFMVFDTTNAVPYTERVLELIDVWYGYLQQGWKVPQLAFYTNSASGAIANLLYDTLYNNAELKAKYPDIDKLWFRMNGKPMIVGNADDPEMRPEVKDYFRIKAVQWPTDDKHSDGFPWIEFGTTLHTVGGYYKNSLQDESIMNVSVAQHTESCRSAPPPGTAERTTAAAGTFGTRTRARTQSCRATTSRSSGNTRSSSTPTSSLSPASTSGQRCASTSPANQSPLSTPATRSIRATWSPRRAGSATTTICRW